MRSKLFAASNTAALTSASGREMKVVGGLAPGAARPVSNTRFQVTTVSMFWARAADAVANTKPRAAIATTPPDARSKWRSTNDDERMN